MIKNKKLQKKSYFKNIENNLKTFQFSNILVLQNIKEYFF